MRYLKPFNESKKFDDLKTFCEENLAYLFDNKDYRITFRSDTTDPFTIENYKYISITKFNRVQGVINWCDIKDYLIPFINALQDEYKLNKFVNKKDKSLSDIAFIEPTGYKELFIYYKVEDLEDLELSFEQILIKVDLSK